MTKALDVAHHAASQWLSGLADRPVAASAGLAELRRAFGGPLPADGKAPEAVIKALASEAARGMHGSAGGRFFAWVIGGGLESALAADWLVAAWDQNAGLYTTGPAAAVIEETAGAWIKDLLALPAEASFAFTSGCQMAHTTCLAAARWALLRQAHWDVESDGLCGAPRIRVLASNERHASVDRSLRLLGIGQRALVPLATDSRGRITPDALRVALAEGDGPTLLVLNAADLNIGECDLFRTLIPIAQAAGAWVHVDGAFGLFARASRTYRALVDGVDHADSWATDAHKWLNVPYDCGIAIVRDHTAHRAAMASSASYLAPSTDVRDQVDWTPEYSRRARGIPVYAALQELGRRGVEDLVDRCCSHALAIVEGIGALPGVEILARPVLNQGLLRFIRPDASPDENDRFTDEMIARINAGGEAFFSGTRWRGRRAMRVSVVNWRTGENDVRRTIAAAAKVVGSA